MSIILELFSDMKNYPLIRNEWTAGPVLYSAFICITKQTAQNRPPWFLMHINVCFKTVAIDIPGGKQSLVKNIIAQTTILKRAIKKI